MIAMRFPVKIGPYLLRKANEPGGWIKLQLNGDTIGKLEREKLLDDLPRCIGRPLTFAEQSLLAGAIPQVVA
jgi:hypothetical protein